MAPFVRLIAGDRTPFWRSEPRRLVLVQKAGYGLAPFASRPKKASLFFTGKKKGKPGGFPFILQAIGRN